MIGPSAAGWRTVRQAGSWRLALRDRTRRSNNAFVKTTSGVGGRDDVVLLIEDDQHLGAGGAQCASGFAGGMEPAWRALHRRWFRGRDEVEGVLRDEMADQFGRRLYLNEPLPARDTFCVFPLATLGVNDLISGGWVFPECTLEDLDRIRTGGGRQSSRGSSSRASHHQVTCPTRRGHSIADGGCRDEREESDGDAFHPAFVIRVSSFNFLSASRCGGRA